MAPGVLCESFVLTNTPDWNERTYIQTAAQADFVTDRCPKHLSGKLVWTGAQFTTESDYTLHLTPEGSYTSRTRSSTGFYVSMGTELPREKYWDRFLEFRRTPMYLRPCIQACTAGAPEWRGRFRSLMRKGNRLYSGEELDRSGDRDQDVLLAQEAAINWWLVEVQEAKRFLEARTSERAGRISNGATSDSMTLASQRPSLMKVKETINDAELFYGKTA